MKKVIFLRGVNVNGVKIKMTDLKKSLESFNFTSVETILATGNVIVDVANVLDTNHLKDDIEKKLREDFNYDAFVVLMSQEDLSGALDHLPFEGAKDRQNYLILTSSVEIYEAIEALYETEKDVDKEAFKRVGEYAYWTVGKGYTLKTAFGKKLLGSKKFKPFITTRNINTILKIDKKMRL